MSIWQQTVELNHGLSLNHPFRVDSNFFAHPQSNAGPDMHYSMQLGVVLAGGLKVEYPTFRTAILPGQVWWASCWEPHTVRATHRRTQHLVLTFLLEAIGNVDPFGQFEWISPFSVEPPHRPQARDAETRRKILLLGKDIQRLNCAHPLGWQTLLWLKIHEMILALCQAWTPPARRKGTSDAAGGMSRIMPAIELVNNDMDHRVDLKKAAQICHLSVSRFSEVFHNIMGVSFAKYAVRARVAGAAYELKTTKSPLKSLAASWGFTDASHFHHVFARHFHCSPTVYRKKRASPRRLQ